MSLATWGRLDRYRVVRAVVPVVFPAAKDPTGQSALGLNLGQVTHVAHVALVRVFKEAQDSAIRVDQEDSAAREAPVLAVPAFPVPVECVPALEIR